MKGKIFNAQEVQSILNGSKVMFREVIKPQNILIDSSRHGSFEIENGILKTYHRLGGVWHLTAKLKCPYQVGQKIFCKEKFALTRGLSQTFAPNTLIYFADKDNYWPSIDIDCAMWQKASEMKQEHSRLFPVIKEIKVERLGEISRGDCMAEGCPFPNIAKETNPKEWFANYWNATHKKPEEKFEANPWVFVYTMEVVK